jgi:DnaK suppressor protein
MEIEYYRNRLKQREAELLPDIERLENEAREARSAEVEDPIDQVTSDEGRAAAFGVASREYEELRLVRESLERIQNGTYGKCIVCGRDIPEERLRAIPWTPYCLEHAKTAERDSPV